MSESFDVIVVGVGAMGSAAVYQLAKRGARVLGIDRFDPPHGRGSTHGETRITRLAVGEGPEYVPFVKRSHDIWRELQAETGRTVFYESGGLIIAPIEGAADYHGQDSADFATATAHVGALHNVPVSKMSAEEVRAQYPMLNMPDDEHAVYEPTGGIVLCEDAIDVQIQAAEKHGATIHRNETVLAWHETDGNIEVKTDQAVYHANQLIVTSGAWVGDFVPENKRPLFTITRQLIFWFEVDDLSQYRPERFPFAIWINREDEPFFCTFPSPIEGSMGVKVLTEQFIETTTPDTVQTDVSEAEIEAFLPILTHRMPSVSHRCIKAASCLYTNTPGDRFVIDRHPDSNQVWIASPCSGHGFKHSAAIGEALAQQVLHQHSDLDLSPFRFDRLPIQPDS